MIQKDRIKRGLLITPSELSNILVYRIISANINTGEVVITGIVSEVANTYTYSELSNKYKPYWLQTGDKSATLGTVLQIWYDGSVGRLKANMKLSDGGKIDVLMSSLVLTFQFSENKI